jgi:hypothetical protein
VEVHEINFEQSWIIALVEHLPKKSVITQHKKFMSYQGNKIVMKHVAFYLICDWTICLLLFIHQDLQKMQQSIIYSKIDRTKIT